MAVRVHNTLLERRGRKVGFKALGSWITFEGRQSKELAMRVAAAWRAYHKHRDALTCSKTSIIKRLKFLDQVVEGPLYWCAGTWHLACKQKQFNRKAQHKMTRSVIGLRRDKGEEDGSFHKRCNQANKYWRQQAELLDWDLRQERKKYTWAGHIARLDSYDPLRITHLVFLWKSVSWIKQYEAIHKSQHHGRKIRQWRWEWSIWQFFKKKGSNVGLALHVTDDNGSGLRRITSCLALMTVAENEPLTEAITKS